MTFADPPPPYEQHVNSFCAAPSPPLEAKGHTHKFFFDSSANSSNVSSPSNMEDDSSAEDSASLTDEPAQLDEKPVITVKDGDFDVEEISENDIGYDDDTEVVHPDGFEDAKDKRGGPADDAGIARSFEELNCEDENISSEEERRRRTERRKKRWSGRQFKRTYSQSFGSDTDEADLGSLGSHESGSHTRRLRRKLNGRVGEPTDRSSLILEDLGDSYTFTEEENNGGGGMTRPPSIPSDLEGLQALPFWVLQDRMEVDSGSSGPPSSA
ncbi:hypothetical protein MPH_04982 [Macrophomina phaseolina MS6]|uniref:Uncharacterized protein n=1 Tax=Macrophomina phaseolina (strain MS6) TaxID=1126212 RepID=K2RYG9_MACPH|nr:hypothetical protein MPH_04982 [Macrophomina phaseolina MS6]